MRAAEPNLALAASRPGKDEDTLTEVLAGALALDHRLAEASSRGCLGAGSPASRDFGSPRNGMFRASALSTCGST